MRCSKRSWPRIRPTTMCVRTTSPSAGVPARRWKRRALSGWRCLLDSPLREQALQALEAHYEATQAFDELAGVLEMRAAACVEPAEARAFAYRAADLRASKETDKLVGLGIWRRLLEA